MNESVRELLRQGADTVERPRLDVDDLVARAERRLVRRRAATWAASTVVVAAVAAGAVILQPGEDRRAPAPPVPVETPKIPKTPKTSEIPELTPVSGSVIYFAAKPNSASDWIPGRGDNDIYLRRGLEPKQRIISSDADERCPAVSPDGTELAYLSGPYDLQGLIPGNLVVVPLDPAGDAEVGSRRVLQRGAQVCPQWSPDSRRLAVVADGQDWSTPELRVVALDGKARLLAVLPPYVAHFAWSPDGDAVAYLTEDAVWIAPLDGGEPELFWRSTPTPDTEPQGIPLPSAPSSLEWLSSGELAVGILSDRVSDGWPYVPEGPGELHVIDVRTGRHEELGRIASRGQVVWSPDDSQLAAASADGHRIMVHDRASDSTVVLRPKLDGVDEFWIDYVSWSPDGDRLLVGVQRGPDSQRGPFALLSMAPDGTAVEVVTPWTDTLYPR